MSGDEERVSKRARKNYPGEVSFGALSKEENEHSVAQVSRCTDTGNCTWTEDGTKPQLLGGLGEEGGGCSSLQQMVEEEFGELSFLLGEPQVRTVIIQYSTNGNNTRYKIILYYNMKFKEKSEHTYNIVYCTIPGITLCTNTFFTMLYVFSTCFDFILRVTCSYACTADRLQQ